MGRRRRGARPADRMLLPPRARGPDPGPRVRQHAARPPPPRRAVARRGPRRPAQLAARGDAAARGTGAALGWGVAPPYEGD
jgi:hypothetical protein